MREAEWIWMTWTEDALRRISASAGAWMAIMSSICLLMHISVCSGQRMEEAKWLLGVVQL